jgi:hypothetical protein
MSEMQTAVEWLAEYLTNKGYINAPTFTHKLIDDAINYAKEIEKQQMKDAVLDNVTTNKGLRKIFEKQFEQYYKKTYGHKEI